MEKKRRNQVIDIGAYEYDGEQVKIAQLRKGWNLISFNHSIQPENLHTMLESVLPELDYVGIFLGEEMQYLHKTTLENSPLSNFYKYGYWVKMNEACSFFTPQKIIDLKTPIYLNKGWNLVSYLPITADSIKNALSSIYDNLAAVLGFKGKGLGFNPKIDDKINTLHVLKSGYGYWIKLSSPDTLIYPSIAREVIEQPESVDPDIIATCEWICLWGKNVTFKGEPVLPGTKIKAYNNKNILCGSYIVKDTGKVFMMPIYRDDSSTNIYDGANPGDFITLKIGNSLFSKPIKWRELGEFINIDTSLTVVNNDDLSFPKDFIMSQNFPNPFNSITKVSFMIPHSTDVSIKVFDILGKEVLTLTGHFEIGEHTKIIDCSNLASGIYFLSFIAETNSERFSKVIKLVQMR